MFLQKVTIPSTKPDSHRITFTGFQERRRPFLKSFITTVPAVLFRSFSAKETFAFTNLRLPI